MPWPDSVVIRRHRRRSSRPWQCDYCAGPISPGTTHERFTLSIKKKCTTKRACWKCSNLLSAAEWVGENIATIGHAPAFVEDREDIEAVLKERFAWKSLTEPPEYCTI